MFGLCAVSLLAVVSACSAANILVISPTPSISHQLPFHSLCKSLLDRGHRLTLITTDSMKLTHHNYTEIELSASYKFMLESYDLTKAFDAAPIDAIKTLTTIGHGVVDYQLRQTSVQKLISSGETFDLAIMEGLGIVAYHGLIHKVGAPPVVKFVTMHASPAVYYNLGNPVYTAFMPDPFLGYSHHMDFWQRLYNTYFYLWQVNFWFHDGLIKQDEVMRKHFGQDLPPIYDMDRNVSLVIISSHFCLEYPRPHLPSIIEITSTHVATERKPLPKDLQTFLDEAEHGVVYFSLGSNVRSADLPEWKRRAFVEAFRQLPQRVLWKWEDDSLPDQPHNLMVSKWLPQQDVLAHRNVRLFITQGGLQSLSEATFHAVPLLVMPFFADQAHNAAKVQQAGIGLWLEIGDVTKEVLLRHLRTLLEDSSYKDNMKRLSAVFREHMAESLDKAVWWIEYVIRHDGAPHLRSAALDLRWWQLLLLDVIGLVLLVVTAAGCLAYLLVRRVLSALLDSNTKIKAQ